MEKIGLILSNGASLVSRLPKSSLDSHPKSYHSTSKVYKLTVTTEMLTKGTQEGLGIGNGGDDPDYLARRVEPGGGGARGRRRGAQ